MGRRSRGRGRFGAPNLIKNGHFDDGLEGWSITQAESAAVVDGWLVISQVERGYSYVQVFIDVIAGRLYEFSVVVSEDTPRGSVQLYDGNVDLVTTFKFQDSGKFVQFRPTNDRVRIMARLNAEPGTGRFDDFILREA